MSNELLRELSLADDGFRKELNLMCNLSELVEEKGIEQGIEQGIKQGIEQAKKEIVISLLKLGTVGEEDIMKVAGISEGQLEIIKEEMVSDSESVISIVE